MIKHTVAMICALACGWMLHGAASAHAAPKTVVFPFELSVPARHPDDLLFGTTIEPEEKEWLEAVTKELRSLLSESGQYDVTDLSSLAEEIEAAAPLHQCNGCETDLAKKAGADIAVLPLMQKSSATLANMSIGIQDVASGRLLKSETVIIQGNTEEAWLRAVRWLVKRKLAVKQTDKKQKE